MLSFIENLSVKIFSSIQHIPFKQIFLKNIFLENEFQNNLNTLNFQMLQVEILNELLIYLS